MSTTSSAAEHATLPALVAPAPFVAGTVLSGKYRIERRLGGGGMGAVYAALNIHLNRCVALKVMHAWTAESPDLVARFHNEARAAAIIGHPNIVDVFDVGQTEDGLPYVVMEVLHGEDLFERMARTGPLDTTETVRIARQILAALEEVHRRGIIHCDLKPENVFLATGKADGTVAKLLDFGVARFGEDCTAESGWAWDGLLAGTPAYMSPEQAAGKALDQTTDLYSLGVMIYEMLSGVVAYDGEEREVLTAIVDGPAPRLHDVAPHVQPGLARIVDRAMARAPSDRFPNAAAFAAALEPFAVATRRSTSWSAAGSPAATIPPVRPRAVRWQPLPVGLALVFFATAVLAWRGPLRPYAERAGVEVARSLGPSVTPVVAVRVAASLATPRPWVRVSRMPAATSAPPPTPLQPAALRRASRPAPRDTPLATRSSPNTTTPQQLKP